MSVHEVTVTVTRGGHRASVTVLIRDDESATDAVHPGRGHARRRRPGRKEGGDVTVDSWMDRAACAGAPLEWFIPPDRVRGRSRRQLEALAKSVCDRCPVTAECLTAAEDERDSHAVRGGLTPSERGWDRTGSWHKGTTPCDECGDPYTRQRPMQRYCSPHCSAQGRARTRRDYARRQAREVAV